jgi:long-chain acyl-CoA synthetase
MEKETPMELSATIPALLRQQVATYGSETIIRVKYRGIWKAITWSELDTRVREIGQGLRAAGVTPGDVVAVLSETRPDLVYADLAILGCGAVSLAIHLEEDVKRVGEILRGTGAVCAIVEGEEQLDKVLSIRSSCPRLRVIVIIDMKGLREFNDPACISLPGLIENGAGQPEWQASVASVGAEQTAALLQTGLGTLQAVSYAELSRLLEVAGETLGVRSGDERLAVLPMSDPNERVLGLYLALKYRIVSNYLENPETATENLREVKPTVLGANREAWDRLQARIAMMADNATPVQKYLYRWAINSGAREGLPAALANFFVLPAVRDELGVGRLRVAFVGDGNISPEVDLWARAMKIVVRHYNPFRKEETHA